MRKFRINNDVPVIWRIVDKQTLMPFDLEGKTVKVALQNRFGIVPIEEFEVSGNVISFIFKAAQQGWLGVYTATVSIVDAEGHTWTMDACQMLELVSQSCCADVCGSHGVDETSGVEFQQVIFVDSELNAESKNPVSNSAVTKAIQGIKSDTLVIDEKINREIEERKAENNVLSLRINQEEAERKASDNSLLEKINHETDERKESESMLYAHIEEESNQRKEAYNALDGNISEEIEARKAADSAIGDRINALSDKVVQTSPQNFSEEQKAQARENIGVPSTPSGDPMHYAYVDAGAAWSSSTRYWSLNGLTDITNEQMRKIYNVGFICYLAQGPLSGARASIRTNLLRIGVSNYQSGDNLQFLALDNKTIEVINLKNSSGLYESAISATSFFRAFDGCTALREIYGILTSSGSLSNVFRNCTSLQRVRISNLNINLDLSYSPLIDKESIVYAITKAEPTQAISITLHAEAYDRLVNDADVLAALKAQPLISLISA